MLAMICRSDGACRNFFRGNYRDLAPPEHALALEMSKLQGRARARPYRICQTPLNQANWEAMSLAERAAKAAKIAQEPELYKVCEGCDSIVTRRVSTCPNCHGYRFEEDPVEVIRQANILGSREKTSVLTEDLQ
jgi:hypothetical protein